LGPYSNQGAARSRLDFKFQERGEGETSEGESLIKVLNGRDRLARTRKGGEKEKDMTGGDQTGRRAGESTIHYVKSKLRLHLLAKF